MVQAQSHWSTNRCSEVIPPALAGVSPHNGDHEVHRAYSPGFFTPVSWLWSIHQRHLVVKWSFIEVNSGTYHQNLWSCVAFRMWRLSWHRHCTLSPAPRLRPPATIESWRHQRGTGSGFLVFLSQTYWAMAWTTTEHLQEQSTVLETEALKTNTVCIDMFLVC